jgi:hypothetical protein
MSLVLSSLGLARLSQGRLAMLTQDEKPNTGRSVIHSCPNMATYSDLPPELELCIAEVLPASDCFRFVLTRKRLWTLAKGLIAEHKALSSTFDTVSTAAYGHTVWELYNSILDKPKVAEYVKVLELHGNRALWYDTDVYAYAVLTPASRRPPEADVSKYLESAAENEYLQKPLDHATREERMHNSEPLDVGQLIQGGTDGPIIALLLPMLNNLRLLRYTAAGDMAWVFHMFRQMALSYHMQPAMVPFQQLTQLHVAFWNEDAGCFRWLQCLLRLPSLEEVWISMGRGSYRQKDMDAELTSLPPRKSNISRLTLAECALDAEAVDWIIGQCKALKTFSCYFTELFEATDHLYDSRHVIASLARNCSQTLEALFLDNVEDYNRASMDGEIVRAMADACTEGSARRKSDTGRSVASKVRYAEKSTLLPLGLRADEERIVCARGH